MKPDRLIYAGDGSRYFAGVPARDLDAADIANLSDETLAEITAPNPATGEALYQVPRAAAKAPRGDDGKEDR